VSIAPGTRLGAYEVIGLVGAGGMGEVYKARDVRLDRSVALKILPTEVAADPDRRARFEREARAISSLDHPHICSLFDVGEHNGMHFLVLPHLDGETLAERLTRGVDPLDRTLRTAVEIAGALEAAHRRGIVHRDLKPGNIMLTKSGAKLLDFGLAKQRNPVLAPAAGGPALTATAGPATAEGSLLGTMPYMAPEQVEGHDADARSDMFAFGAVLYEMVTGRRAFEGGGTPAGVLAAIMKDDPPPLSRDGRSVPPALERLIRTCLAKDPDERWQNAGDVARALASIAVSGDDAPSTPGRLSGRRRERVAWGIALAAGALLVVSLLPAVRKWWSAPAPDRQIEFEVFPPPNATFAATGASIPSTQFALSPDGRRLAFVATQAGGRPTLWIRPLDSRISQMIAGTEGASFPFWSPDSAFVGFFAQGKLMKVAVSGGPPQGLCDATTGARGGTWSRNGIIVFAASTGGGLSQVSAAGGLPSPATTPSDGESSHRWPAFLPGGRRFIFFTRRAEHPGIYVGAIDGGTHTQLLDTTANALYAAGQLLTVRDGTLLAYPFDADRLRITGEPARVAERVGGSSSNFASFSASQGGVLAYAGGLTTFSRLTWFDREGKALGTATDIGDYVNFRLSPDGARLAIGRVDPLTSTSDIWLLDVARGVLTRFTSHPLTDTAPIWSPDGTRIVFRSDRAGGNFPFEKAATGGQPERQIGTDDTSFPTDWSPDGKLLLFHTPAASTSYDVRAIPPSGGKPTPVVQTPFADIDGRLSPDGRWVAYASDEPGRMEVFVQPFAQSGNKWQVSTGGGSEPRWRRDGRELFYLAPDGTLMAVAITATSAVEIGAPRVLFRARVPFAGSEFRTNYDVTADGRRFLVNSVVEGAGATPITVVVNWKSTAAQ
jgi:eukaryotic-like serine/threonine-protein kinase